MSSLGAELQSAREKKNISLNQISEETRVSLRHLQSLEAGRYGELPGGMYNRAFLRVYCEYVGLDAQQMLSRYEVESAPPSDKSAKSKSRSASPAEYDRKLNPVVVWSLMLVISVAGVYFSRNWIAVVFSPYFSRSPSLDLTAATTSPTPTQKKSGSEPISATTGIASRGTITKPEKLSTHVQPDRLIRLEFQVSQKCWVSVNSDGNRALVKLLEPGDDQSFGAAERFYIVLGNAGGVKLKINGKPARPLGRSGDVVRVLINKRNLEEFLQEKPDR